MLDEILKGGEFVVANREGVTGMVQIPDKAERFDAHPMSHHTKLLPVSRLRRRFTGCVVLPAAPFNQFMNAGETGELQGTCLGAPREICEGSVQEGWSRERLS